MVFMNSKFQLSDFGNKFRADSSISQLMDDLGQAKSITDPIYMLGGGNPACIPAAEQTFRSAMENIMATPNAFEKLSGFYDGPQGNSEFIQSLCHYLNNKFNWQLSTKNIVLTNGSQSGFYTLFNLLAGKAENNQQKQILLPLTPEYIGYNDVGHHEDMFVSYQPVIEEIDNLFFKYRVDFSHLPNDLSNVGAICTSRPTNPTGNVLTNNEVAHLSELAKANNIPFIIDGAYGAPFPNIIFSDIQPAWDKHIILCLSLSKLGLPGARTGIIIAHESITQLVARINAIQSLAVGSFGPMLTNEIIKTEKLDTLSNDIIKPYYQQKLDETIGFVKDSMGQLPIKIHQPEGSIFLWLWMKDLPITSQQLYERLKARGVYVIAGQHFFPGLNQPDWQHQYECIRVSYAGESSIVKRGIEIICEELNKIY